MRVLSVLGIVAVAVLVGWSQELLTNESVVKLVRAGMGEDVIIGTIESQPGKYVISTDQLIALKSAGASDKVIAAMIKRASGTGRTTAVVSPASQSVVLHEGTPVRLRLNRNVSSGDSNTGDMIDFEVLDDIKADDLVVIPRGAKAIGTVTNSEHKKRMARGGKLDVTIDYARLINGDKVPLRGVQQKAGGGHTGAMTGGIVATSLIVWPAAPFFLFMHGKDVTIPKGTEITAYTDSEIKIDRDKLAKVMASAQ